MSTAVMKCHSTKFPKISLHKPSGNARVWIRELAKHVYLGRYGSAESHRQYDQLMRQWGYYPAEAEPEKSVAEDLLELVEKGNEISVAELCISYLEWAEKNYQKNGKPTGELGNAKRIIRMLKSQYGHLPASGFGPLRYIKLREQLEDKCLSISTIQKYMRHVFGVFRKAKNNQLIEPATCEALKDIEPIKLATSNARPPKKTPLPNIDFFESSLRDMRPMIRDMVLITENSAMRVDDYKKEKLDYPLPKELTAKTLAKEIENMNDASDFFDDMKDILDDMREEKEIRRKLKQGELKELFPIHIEKWRREGDGLDSFDLYALIRKLYPDIIV